MNLKFWRKKEERMSLEELLLKADILKDNITKKEALNLPSVIACVEVISNTVAVLPIKLYKEEDGKVKEVIDTTGCGDSYHAGFVCSHLINGNIYEAMRVGTELATETLSHYGGF